MQGNETVFLTQDEINNPYADIPTMIEDKKRKREQMKQTVFDRITQSPEVLAEKLVYYLRYGNCYASSIISDVFKSKEEAIAATVAKLKEVTDE